MNKTTLIEIISESLKGKTVDIPKSKVKNLKVQKVVHSFNSAGYKRLDGTEIKGSTILVVDEINKVGHEIFNWEEIIIKEDGK